METFHAILVMILRRLVYGWSCLGRRLRCRRRWLGRQLRSGESELRPLERLVRRHELAALRAVEQLVLVALVRTVEWLVRQRRWRRQLWFVEQLVRTKVKPTTRNRQLEQLVH